MGDENFERTVILVLEHSDEGALGLVLNRPSGMEVGEPLPGWERMASTPPVVFVGGPVSPESAICLARVQDEDAEGWTGLVGGLGALDLTRDPDEAAAFVEAIRVFAGYAGWTGGQLESEIEAGGWFVVDAEEADAMTADPDDLWREVLRRQRGTLRLFADYPEDPTSN
jgi:putative transcriptional regulator